MALKGFRAATCSDNYIFTFEETRSRAIANIE